MIDDRQLTDVSDESLCALIAQRDESPLSRRQAKDACDALYQRHARGLLAFLATRAGRSDFEDVHQVVWQRVWQSVGTGFTGGNFRAWLFQVSRNYLIDECRKKRPESMAEDFDSRDPKAASAAEILMEQERMNALANCLDKLDADAAALVRARLGGERYEDVCPRLNLQIERAHRLFHSAKEQLRTCIGRESS